jgi:hypothetical protein
MLVYVALSIVLAVVAFVATRRMHASGSLQAAASEDGWAIAGGAKIGPIAVSGARMPGVRGAWAVHLFGRRVAGSNGTHAKKETRPQSALQRRALRVATEMDPIVAMELGLDVFGRVRSESLEAVVRGGDPDPLLMGRVAGVLAVVSGVLAPVARIDSQLDWAAETSSLDVRVAVEASFIPVVIAWDVTRFVFAQLVTRLRKALSRSRRPAAVPQLERA